ncbi:MAG: hypothetical protein R3B06_26615 [Kofleriaceae bacterium]
MNRRRLGGLDCVLTGGTDGQGGGDGPTVVLLHGFGAGGDDLVELGVYLDAPAGTRWVFPAAPLELGGLYGDSRAWWMIDLARLERAEPAIRADECPAGLPEARAAVRALLDELARDFHRADATTVLGGFSQGAMLAVDVALHHGAPLAGLALLSGTLIAVADWRPRMASLAGVTVLQTHGTRDQVLAFAGAERLRDFLLEAGASVGFLPFPGGHELPPPVLEALADLLERTLAPPP